MFLLQAQAGWDIWGFTAEMSLCLGTFIVYFVEELAHFLVCHEVHSPVDHHGKPTKNPEFVRVTVKLEVDFMCWHCRW